MSSKVASKLKTTKGNKRKKKRNKENLFMLRRRICQI